MKVIAINGSPRKGGNTEIMIRKVFEPLEAAAIETELIQVGGKMIRGCLACGKCGEMQNGTCVVENDIVNELIEKLREADGIILGSPTYFANISAELKAVIDRAGFVSFTNGGIYSRKVGAAVIAVRRGGAVPAFDAINHFFQINQMYVVGSTYWNMAYGFNLGEVNEDEEGMGNMTNLGENMAHLLQKLNG
jgi:multimeric flavodoxin WrbA